MNYLIFTVLAYFLNSIAVSIDKFLLVRAIPKPLTYIFYISLISMIALLLIPFTTRPSPAVFALASLSTFLWTLGAYFMFYALRIGQVVRVIPVIGTLIPLILLIFASYTSSISINERWAVVILTLGLFFINLASWKAKLIKKELGLEVLAAFAFALSYIALKEAYQSSDFLSVLVHSRWILIPLGLLVLPKIRFKTQRMPPLFLLGQALGGASQLLIIYSISLASPALVNSLQGVQYVFILFLTPFLAKKFPAAFAEKGSFLIIVFKFVGVFLIVLGLLFLASSQSKNMTMVYGVTYSPRYAHSLGLNPRETFKKMLDDLNVRYVRLPVYWNEVEQFPQTFNFTSLDFYLNEAQKREVSVILVLGQKQPRWPECYAPPWAKNGTKEMKAEKVLKLIDAEIEHFKNFQNIEAWQIENEPFLKYGECDPVTKDTKKLLEEEIVIIRANDSRPILITDSGELSLWLTSQKYADIFGTTLYRSIWSPPFGAFTYPLPPIFYNLKDKLLRAVLRKNGETIISELQAEPWIPKQEEINTQDAQSLSKLFPVSNLRANLDFARETGFSKAYLWGVEWWYFMAQAGHPQYLEFAKGLF